MFQIKICGITNEADVAAVVAAGADAIGLNFYPGSRRYIAPDLAERLVAKLPKRIQRVGLFVNATDDEVCRAYDQLQLDLIQLHGDEPPEFLMSLGGRPVMRALRLGPAGLKPIVAYLDQCRGPGVDLRAVLIDAYQPQQYGGTGKTADWDSLHDQRAQLGDLPLVLAGGLTHRNVAAAVRTAQPAAVDTASGVEAADGTKDLHLVQQFVRSARDALNAIG